MGCAGEVAEDDAAVDGTGASVGVGAGSEDAAVDAVEADAGGGGQVPERSGERRALLATVVVVADGSEGDVGAANVDEVGRVGGSDDIDFVDGVEFGGSNVEDIERSGGGEGHVAELNLLLTGCAEVADGGAEITEVVVCSGEIVRADGDCAEDVGVGEILGAPDYGVATDGAVLESEVAADAQDRSASGGESDVVVFETGIAGGSDAAFGVGVGGVDVAEGVEVEFGALLEAVACAGGEGEIEASEGQTGDNEGAGPHFFDTLQKRSQSKVRYKQLVFINGRK